MNEKLIDIDKLAHEIGLTKRIEQVGGFEVAFYLVSDFKMKTLEDRIAALVAEECAKVADASDEYIGDQIRERFKA